MIRMVYNHLHQLCTSPHEGFEQVQMLYLTNWMKYLEIRRFHSDLGSKTIAPLNE
jgi:hypothetical protein